MKTIPISATLRLSLIHIFLGPDGNVIQPDAAVNVCFFNAGVSGEAMGVYHVANDGSSVSAVSARQADAAAQSFDVSHFSIYVVTAEGTPKLATYNFYGVDGALVGTQIVKTGESLFEPEAPPVADGQFFQGWYAKNGEDWAGDVYKRQGASLPPDRS